MVEKYPKMLGKKTGKSANHLDKRKHTKSTMKLSECDLHAESQFQRPHFPLRNTQWLKH